MEMSQAERKQYKTVQFRPEDLDEILALAAELEKELGVKMSQAAAIMYAVRQIKKKG